MRRYPHLRISVRGPGPSGTSTHLTRQLPGTHDAIFGLENIIVVYLAARLALKNTLAVGMIFALMSYKQHFTYKSAQLIEKALEFRLLGLHLERLADIALTPLECGHDQVLAYTRQVIRIPGEGLGLDSCAVAKRVGWCAMSRGGRPWRGLLVI